MNPLSLSAGSVLDLAPADVVRCAAEAGYALAGVRLADPRAEQPAVARALAATGLGLLDVEVVRLREGPLDDGQRRLATTAAELGARFLLTVSEDPDEHRTADRIGELATLLRGSTTRIALEPMRFTAVGTRTTAERIARAAGPDVTVLLDPLHLHRGGTDLTEPADPALTGYAQLTDVEAPDEEPDDLAREARHLRVPPGRGGLDLTGFVRGLPPGVPLAVEVQSDRLLAEPPVPRAVLLRQAALAVLDRGGET